MLKRQTIDGSCSQENGAFVLLPVNLKNTAWGSSTYLDRYPQDRVLCDSQFQQGTGGVQPMSEHNPMVHRSFKLVKLYCIMMNLKITTPTPSITHRFSALSIPPLTSDQMKECLRTRDREPGGTGMLTPGGSPEWCQLNLISWN